MICPLIMCIAEGASLAGSFVQHAPLSRGSPNAAARLNRWDRT